MEKIKFITVPVKIGNRTEEVVFGFYGSDDRGSSNHVAAARIGNGAKLHRTQIRAIRWDSMAEARRFAYGSPIHEIDGSFVTVRMDTVIHGKPARIVAWADSIEGSSMGSQWNSSAKI